MCPLRCCCWHSRIIYHHGDGRSTLQQWQARIGELWIPGVYYPGLLTLGLSLHLYRELSEQISLSGCFTANIGYTFPVKHYTLSPEYCANYTNISLSIVRLGKWMAMQMKDHPQLMLVQTEITTVMIMLSVIMSTSLGPWMPVFL